MSTNAEAVIEAALRLPRTELEEVVARLVASLDGFENAEVRAAWAAETERRLDELERGDVKAIPWAEVRASARARVHGRD